MRDACDQNDASAAILELPPREVALTKERGRLGERSAPAQPQSPRLVALQGGRLEGTPSPVTAPVPTRGGRRARAVSNQTGRTTTASHGPRKSRGDTGDVRGETPRARATRDSCDTWTQSQPLRVRGRWRGRPKGSGRSPQRSPRERGQSGPDLVRANPQLRKRWQAATFRMRARRANNELTLASAVFSQGQAVNVV